MQLLSIDVTKIDKTALVAGKPKPDGHVPKYMDLAMMDNKAGRDEYGNDGFIVQSLPKARRDAGERGPIIGNWKTLERRGAAAPPKPSKPAPADGAPTEDDDVPF